MRRAKPLWETPDWALPAGVHALLTTREGGHSDGPWSSWNIGSRSGDAPVAVTQNRARLLAKLRTPHPVRYLQQVHGRDVLFQAEMDPGEVQADAHWTATPGLPLAVLAADCLPVLFCSADGLRIAAAHAGWRGLVAGVLQRTVQELRAHGPAGMPLLAWVGPGIGPCHFEVGAEVREAFHARDAQWAQPYFTEPVQVADTARWHADLAGLAVAQLRSLGVRVRADGRCTHCDEQRFYSYRRDGQTGRMAALIWRDANSLVAERRPALPESP